MDKISRKLASIWYISWYKVSMISILCVFVLLYLPKYRTSARAPPTNAPNMPPTANIATATLISVSEKSLCSPNTTSSLGLLNESFIAYKHYCDKCMSSNSVYSRIEILWESEQIWRVKYSYLKLSCHMSEHSKGLEKFTFSSAIYTV